MLVSNYTIFIGQIFATFAPYIRDLNIPKIIIFPQRISNGLIIWSSNFNTKTDSERKEKKQDRKNDRLIMHNIM